MFKYDLPAGPVVWHTTAGFHDFMQVKILPT
jgi:hypothetical protein